MIPMRIMSVTPSIVLNEARTREERDTYPFVDVQFPEYFSRVEEVLIIKDPFEPRLSVMCFS